MIVLKASANRPQVSLLTSYRAEEDSVMRMIASL